jgi:isoquinoline 1-oxidoreductase alpha subunit
MKLTVNGVEHDLDIAPDTPLLWAIRDALNLTGTKYGCGIGQCGACAVHIDGKAARACLTLAGDAAGKSIVTIEGLTGKVADAVQAAWRDLNVVQCGYCQSGQIMTAIALLAQNPRATDTQIAAAMDGNICRCAAYVRIRSAIKRAQATIG